MYAATIPLVATSMRAWRGILMFSRNFARMAWRSASKRSEEHTSELQSRRDLVCRLLLEKKKNIHDFSTNAKVAIETDTLGLSVAEIAQFMSTRAIVEATCRIGEDADIIAAVGEIGVCSL